VDCGVEEIRQEEGMTVAARSMLYLLCAFAACTAPVSARAQTPPLPVRLGVTVPLPLRQDPARPPVTTNAVLTMAAAGAAGGAAGLVAAGIPMIFAGFAGVPKPADAMIAGTLGGAFIAGTTLGVHWGGRQNGMRAQPLATIGGALLGAGLVAVSGVPLVSDDEDYRRPNAVLLLPPALGATGGYLLTRRPRQPPEP
jgi:hypothetical protein